MCVCAFTSTFYRKKKEKRVCGFFDPVSDAPKIKPLIIRVASIAAVAIATSKDIYPPRKSKQTAKLLPNERTQIRNNNCTANGNGVPSKP